MGEIIVTKEMTEEYVLGNIAATQDALQAAIDENSQMIPVYKEELRQWAAFYLLVRGNGLGGVAVELDDAEPSEEV